VRVLVVNAGSEATVVTAREDLGTRRQVLGVLGA
jgi:hypothetical protein